MPNTLMKQAPNIVGVAENANLTGIFIQLLMQILSELAKQIMFPFAALSSILQVILTYRQLYLEKGKERSTIFRAVVQTVSAIAITVAVIGGLAFAVLFQMAAPIIFTAVLGINALINFGTACFYYGKYRTTQDPDDYNKARDNMIGAAAGSLATVGVGLVLLGGFAACSIFGIVAGVIGTLFSIYNTYKTYKKLQLESIIEDPQSEYLIAGKPSEENDRPLSPSTDEYLIALNDEKEPPLRAGMQSLYQEILPKEKKAEPSKSTTDESVIKFDLWKKAHPLLEEKAQPKKGLVRSQSFSN